MACHGLLAACNVLHGTPQLCSTLRSSCAPRCAPAVLHGTLQLCSGCALYKHPAGLLLRVEVSILRVEVSREERGAEATKEGEACGTRRLLRGLNRGYAAMESPENLHCIHVSVHCIHVSEGGQIGAPPINTSAALTLLRGKREQRERRERRESSPGICVYLRIHTYIYIYCISLREVVRAHCRTAVKSTAELLRYVAFVGNGVHPGELGWRKAGTRRPRQGGTIGDPPRLPPPPRCPPW